MTNRAFRLRGEVLGEEMPLSVVPEWADLSQKTVLEGVKGPLFGLITMPFANMVEPDSPLPVSLFAGAMESIMEFDQVYSELLYELHSGRRKNIIERTAIVPEGKRKRIRGVRYQDPATDTYILDPEKLKNAKPDMAILHPLPRVNEITVDVDDDPRARYFQQAANGRFIRMALIMKMLGLKA